jgi:lipopolysaccharide transport system permease protein
VTRPATIGPAWWALPPAFVLLVVLSAALSILCSVLTAQLRDLAPLMAALFPVLWLMSPITIPPDAFRAARAGWLVDLNPVYYIVELVRAPLLRGEWPALHPVLVSTSVVAAVTLAAFAALAASGRRLVYRL